jgi:hypothetical protein
MLAACDRRRRQRIIDADYDDRRSSRPPRAPGHPSRHTPSGLPAASLGKGSRHPARGRFECLRLIGRSGLRSGDGRASDRRSAQRLFRSRRSVLPGGRRRLATAGRTEPGERRAGLVDAGRVTTGSSAAGATIRPACWGESPRIDEQAAQEHRGFSPGPERTKAATRTFQRATRAPFGRPLDRHRGRPARRADNGRIAPTDQPGLTNRPRRPL